MADGWDERKNAQENQYFDKLNRESLEKLKKGASSKRPRLSPITGEPMEEVSLMGITVDRCPASGGIWLDKGELEQLIGEAKKHDAQKSGETFVERLFLPFFKK